MDPDATTSESLRVHISPRLKTDKRKRVLVVSHAFWPVNVIGAMRPLHVVAEWLREGYEPTVLTLGHWDKKVEDHEYGVHTANRVRIVRVYLFRIVLWLRKLCDWLKPVHDVAARSRFGPVRTFLRRVLDVLVRAVDAPLCKLGVVTQGLWLSVGHRPDCIYCSAPPFQTLLGSALLARCLRVPFVADFRDLWTLNEYFEWRHLSKLRARFENWSERFVLKSASYVIYNTGMAKTMMDVKYPEYADKSSVVTNGILVAGDRVVSNPDADGPFTIVHVGTVYLDRDPSDFLEGLREWMERRGSEVDGRIVVKLVGRGSDRIVERMRADGHKARIEPICQKPKADLGEIFAGAHLLLLCLGYRDGSKYVVPAKMYDYLAMNKPIIAYAPRDGEVARLMKEIGLEGNVVTEPDNSRTMEILDREYDRFVRRDHPFSVAPEVKHRYDYGEIAGKIERVIAQAVDTR